jgi:hypothetical protein
MTINMISTKPVMNKAAPFGAAFVVGGPFCAAFRQRGG